MLMVLGVVPVSMEISLVDRFTLSRVARYFSPCVSLGWRVTNLCRNSLFLSSMFVSKALLVLSPLWHWLIKVLILFRWGTRLGAVSYTHLDVYKRQLCENHSSSSILIIHAELQPKLGELSASPVSGL